MSAQIYKFSTLDAEPTEEGAQYTAAVGFVHAGTEDNHWRRLEVGWGGQTPSKSGRASPRSLRVASAAQRVCPADTDPDDVLLGWGTFCLRPEVLSKLGL